MTFRVAVVPVTPFQQNCAILFDDETKEGAVFDPGGDVDRIMGAIEKAGVQVTKIVLTHGHIDHAAGAMDLKERLGVELVGPHEDDAPLLSGLEEQARMFGVTEAVRNAVPDRWLSHGDTETIAGVDFTVSHTPGHAPGHVVFHAETLGFAHVGDVLFRGSIGRTDLPRGDHETLLASIRDVCLQWPDETQFLCGHGPDSTIGEERATNPFLQGITA